MKTGGRVKGTPNRATVEKRLEIARHLDDARNHGRPLAKDRLEELMELAHATMLDRLPPRPGQNGDATPPVVYQPADDFPAWFDRAVHCAATLAKYQSPTFKAVAVSDVSMQHAPLNLDKLTERELRQLMHLIVLAGPANTVGPPAALPHARTDRAGSGETKGL